MMSPQDSADQGREILLGAPCTLSGMPFYTQLIGRDRYASKEVLIEWTDQEDMPLVFDEGPCGEVSIAVCAGA